MRKSRDYLMKCLGFVLLFGFISLGAIGGCNNNGGGQGGTRALTERDFFNNPGLSANPEEGVVVTFLEPAEAFEEDNLTGGLGFDVIPHKYTRTLNHTICWEDDNDDSKHFMILLNSDGEEVLRVEANGGCVTVLIEPGDYEMVLTHGEHVEEIETVFLIPTPEEEQVTKRDEFDQKEFKTANVFSYKMHRYLPGELVKFFESISNVFTRPARAQTTGTPSANLTTLINTNGCERCNLDSVDLTSLNLAGADLTGAVLINANLSLANLATAKLAGANLSGANLFDANLSGANLAGANLSGANLFDANLSGANLSGANLSGANPNDANIIGATFDGAAVDAVGSLENCICGLNSNSTCVGCACTCGDNGFCQPPSSGSSADINIEPIACNLCTTETFGSTCIDEQ